MNTGIFELDLSKSVLYGWHKSRFASWVEEYRLLIREGKIAPPVPVVYLGNNVYSLDYQAINPDYPLFLDGGHRRAKAHLLEGKPLPVYISEGGIAVPLEKRVSIAEMRLIS